MSDLLAGIRVVESTALLNGDTLGAHLAHLGAEVVKIEAPGTGDYLRHMFGQVSPGRSPAHLQANRGIRSLTVNLRSRAGREIFWKLHRTADVFIDGNRPGTLDRLGVGYAAQRERNPDIVYCQYTGFGAEGPYAGIPAHGTMVDALAAARPREPADDGCLRPVPSQPPFGGMEQGGEGTAAGAIHAAFHVAALVQRERTGQGAFIDVAGTGFPGVGDFTYVGEAGRVAGQPYSVRRPAPDLGQHTREILAELGYSAAEVDELAEIGDI